MSRRRSTIEAVLEANTYRLARAATFSPEAKPGKTASIQIDTLINVAREVDAALGNDHEEPLRGVRCGQSYRWAGTPGQYEMTSRIQIGSLSANGAVNTTIYGGEDGEEPMASHISVADLAACIQAGWLVLEEEPEGEPRDVALVQLPLLTIQEAQLLLGGLRTDEAMSEPRPTVRLILHSLRTALAEAIQNAERQQRGIT
jgi:hypothetical protein